MQAFVSSREAGDVVARTEFKVQGSKFSFTSRPSDAGPGTPDTLDDKSHRQNVKAEPCMLHHLFGCILWNFGGQRAVVARVMSFKGESPMRFFTIALIALALPFSSLAWGQAAGSKAALKNPAALTEKAPDVYKAKFDTSAGSFVIEVHRDWAPNGADRFYNLVKNGYFDGVRFFRVISGFMAQFGINGDPALNTIWRQARIQDDPVKQSNKRGYVSFATSGPNSRTTQVFINFSDRNSQLDASGFAPIGRVVQGMSAVDALNSEYGEGQPNGRGPSQAELQMQGNAYLAKNFPRLDYVKTAVIVTAEK
jgi:peptidyl-prolyl cis-trans isomerase A (cyclophilin A)